MRKIVPLFVVTLLGNLFLFRSAELPGTQISSQLTSPSRVILFTIDTLRADHLECYGYSKAKSPNITRLARDSVRFHNAISAVPLTLPSHCSIFTGTYPVFHGVRDQSGFFLSPGTPTLAVQLRALGFTTGGFVGSFVLDSRFGLNQGFDYYYDRFDASRAKAGLPEMLERRAELVAREAMRWMEAQSKGRFFAWLHFYDPHAPYAPPEPFKSRYAENPYDGEIAYTDSVVGKVLDFLIEKRWYDGALMLLTSDHGEDLGEHGENTHGYFVYDSTLRVPLLIKLPHSQYSGKVVNAQVRTIDIMPTVVQIVGGASSGREQGRSLLSLVVSNSARSPDEAFAETYYPYYHFGWNPLLCIRTSKFKYIDAPRPELYELSSDPGEKKNLAAVNGAVANQLRDRLRAAYGRLASEHSTKREEMDPATQEKLKSLGYLTYSSRASRLGIDRDLPDPKDKLELYTLMQSALMENQNERLDAAIGKLKTLLDLDPTVTDAHIHLGLLYKRLSNFSAAVDEFKLALKSDPSNVVATYNLAHSYASLGRLSDAIIGFKHTLLLNPGESQAHVGLGIAYQMQGDADKAIEHYHAAVAIDPFDSTARNNLASIYLSRRDAIKALEQLRHSLEISGANAQTHNLLGSAHWLKGNAEAAIAEFREAVRLDKSYIDPYLNLGMLLGQQNRFQEALAYLKTATELAPRSGRVFEILAQIYLSAGMRDQADAAFARARQLSQHRER